MKTRWLLCALLVACSVGFLAGVGFSEDPQPSQEEMMKKMRAYATPGAPHKLLAAMVGEWDTVSTNYMNPDKPDVTKGSATNKLILDGRYLHQTFTGTWGGRPHEGQGYMGFDNHLKRYQNLWVDNFGTGMAPAEGPAGKDGKTIELRYVWDGPMGKISGRLLYTLTDKDTFKLDGWMMQGGKEVKTMQIDFARKKKAAAGGAK